MVSIVYVGIIDRSTMFNFHASSIAIGTKDTNNTLQFMHESTRGLVGLYLSGHKRTCMEVRKI